jgi:hypothetical protein
MKSLACIASYFHIEQVLTTAMLKSRNMSRACLGQATSTTTQGLGENKYPGDSKKLLAALKLYANVFEHSKKVILEAGGLVSRLTAKGML